MFFPAARSMSQLPCEKAEDSTAFQLMDMILFWECYMPWFQTVGISLYSLKELNIGFKRWVPPPTADTGFLFASRLSRGSITPYWNVPASSALFLEEYYSSHKTFS